VCTHGKTRSECPECIAKKELTNKRRRERNAAKKSLPDDESMVESVKPPIDPH
jgi:hypothetical protein